MNTRVTRETDPPELRELLELIRSQILAEAEGLSDQQVDLGVLARAGRLIAFIHDRRPHRSITTGDNS